MTPLQEEKLDELLDRTGKLHTSVSNLNLQIGGRGGVLDRLDDHSDRFKAIDAERATVREEIESQKRLVARGLGFIAGVAFIASLAGDIVRAAVARLFGH